MLLAAPGSCVAMESSVGGLPSDALKVTDIGAIDRLDASSLSVSGERILPSRLLCASMTSRPPA